MDAEEFVRTHQRVMTLAFYLDDAPCRRVSDCYETEMRAGPRPLASPSPRLRLPPPGHGRVLLPRVSDLRPRCHQVTDHSTGSDGQHRPRRGSDSKTAERRPPPSSCSQQRIAVIAGFVVLRSITNQTDGSLDVVSVGATDGHVAAVHDRPGPQHDDAPRPRPRPRRRPRRAWRNRMPSSSWPTRAGQPVGDGDGGRPRSDGYTTAPVANGTGPQLERSIVVLRDRRPGLARCRSPARPADPDRPGAPDAGPAAARPPAQRRHGGVDARPGRRRTSARRAADRMISRAGSRRYESCRTTA